ncbi:MAG: ABC transporter permease [Candidatus Aminicenantes bacterium]|nr:ABC transporter permease [Candidatus Aminicenantes bacterium]
MKKKKRPPTAARLLLRFFLNHNHPDEMMGDYEELYRNLAIEKNTYLAGFWFWGQVIVAFPSCVQNSITWGITMIKNYVKITIRQLKRRKGFSFINIAGLSLGMACCFLMLLWVQDEVSFDRFHTNADNLYIVGRKSPHQAANNTRTPAPLAQALADEFPEVKETARFSNRRIFLKSGQNTLTGRTMAYVDPAFLRMFSFPLIQGREEMVFKDPSSILLTEESAKNLFGKQDPIGKTVSVNSRRDFIVTGILKNIPHHSHLQFDALVPFRSRDEHEKKIYGSTSWGVNIYTTYVLLREGIEETKLNSEVDGLVKKHNPRTSTEYFLHPVTRIHLYPLQGEGNLKYLTLFSFLAVFVLVIACINFMNLSTARSGRRAAEIGLRKVVGAGRGQLVRQFLGESLILSFLAFVLAFFLVHIFLPVFKNISGKDVGFSFVWRAPFLLGMAGIALIAGLLAGIYPAFVLSSFRPAEVLRRVKGSQKGGSFFRKILVIFQFAVSILLIVGAAVIHGQLRYMKNADLGFKKDHVVFFGGEGGFSSRFEAVRAEMQKSPFILEAARGNPPIWFDVSLSGVEWDGKDPNVEITFDMNSVDYGYFETMKIKMVEGRTFSRDIASDRTAVIINREAARVMGLTFPLGQTIRRQVFDVQERKFTVRSETIIGVVEDFHNHSFHKKISPVLFDLDPEKSFMVCVRISADNVPGALKHLGEIWAQNVPGVPFEYNFLDETIDDFYRTEQRMGRLFDIFTLLAVFIACLGLFGLAAYTVEQRTKEIGIRKVLGASVPGILVLLVGGFFKELLISAGISWPLGYWLMNRWLERFAYRIHIGWEFFLLSALLAITGALFSVGFQVFKAVRTDPARSLRYE